MAKNYQRRSSADSRANAHQPTSKQLKSSVFQDNRYETALQRELKDLAEHKTSAPATQQTAQLQIEGASELTPPDIFILINNYNSLKNKLTLTQRINSISLIEHVIYQWLIENKSKDLSTNKVAQNVRLLMDTTKTERSRIVSESINNKNNNNDINNNNNDNDNNIENNEIPIAGFDFLDNETQNEVRLMWINLVERRSNIKITNIEKLLVTYINNNDTISENTKNWEFKDVIHEDFTLKILTEFSRLLEGEYGRNLVRTVNKSKRILEIEPFNKENKNRFLAAGMKEGSKEGDDNLIKLEEAPKDFSKEKYPEFTIVNEIERINFFNDLKPLKIGQLGVKVIDGDTTTYYQFGYGTDVTLAIPYNLDDSSLENDSRLADKHDNELATPLFILLGHEIGHGIRIQQGSALGQQCLPPNLLTSQVDIENYSFNTEEYVNINGTENSLRNEHGLGKRKGHYSIPSRQMKEMINKINLIINRIKGYKNIASSIIINSIIKYLEDLKIRVNNQWFIPEIFLNLRIDFFNIENKIANLQSEYVSGNLIPNIKAEMRLSTLEIDRICKNINLHSLNNMLCEYFEVRINQEFDEINLAVKEGNILIFLNNLETSRSLYMSEKMIIINKLILKISNENTENRESLIKINNYFSKFAKTNWLFKK